MKRPSFQFYQEGRKGSKWVTFDITTSSLPRKPACYAIYLDGVLSYVGQAQDLAVRVSSHGIKLGYGDWIATKWGQYKSVLIKARFGDKMGDWAMREIRLIHKLQPRFNCVGSRKVFRK